MERRNRLFRGSNQVLVILHVTIDNFIQLLIELFKLCGLAHVILQHELRGLERSIASLCQKLQAVIDECLVEEDTPLAKEVSTMSDNLDTTLRVIAIEPEQYLMVRENGLLLHRHTLGCPRLLNTVIVLEATSQPEGSGFVIRWLLLTSLSLTGTESWT